MTESYPTPRVVTLVAVDIAKSCHDVLIEPPAPARRRRFREAAEDLPVRGEHALIAPECAIVDSTSCRPIP